MKTVCQVLDAVRSLTGTNRLGCGSQLLIPDYSLHVSVATLETDIHRGTNGGAGSKSTNLGQSLWPTMLRVGRPWQAAEEWVVPLVGA